MRNLLLGLILFLSASVAHAERQFLYMHFEGCPYCPAAKAIIQEKDISQLVLQYDDNFSVDVRVYPEIKETFRRALQDRQGKIYVPQMLIVEVEDGDDTYKSAKVLYVWKNNNGKQALKNALIKFQPKQRRAVLRLKTPLKRIVELFE